MGLREISPTREERDQLRQRFGIAQDPTEEKPEEGDTGTIERKLEAQRGLREAIYKAADLLGSEVAPGPAREQALTHLEAALMWGGKEIFS